MQQVKMFFATDAAGMASIEGSINAWLKENRREIELVDRQMTCGRCGDMKDVEQDYLVVAIWYRTK